MDDYSDKRVLLISDTHANHRNIIRYCGRPCDADRKILDSFQQPPADVVIHLGDFAFGSREQITHAYDEMFLKNEHFNTILIVGNHDEKYKRVLKLPWGKIVYPKEQPYVFSCNGLIYAAQHRPFREFPRKAKVGRWLVQKITDLFLDLHDRKRLGSFLNYQDVPSGINVCLHGHVHELGQRYDWVNNTLLVNVCVEQFDYKPVSLTELELEYYARKDYYERNR